MEEKFQSCKLYFFKKILVVISVGGKWNGRSLGNDCKWKEMLVTWFNMPFDLSGYLPIDRLDILPYIRKIPDSNFNPDFCYGKWGFSWFVYFGFTVKKKLFSDVGVHEQVHINSSVS
jgi:hypothetical protein